MPGGYKKKRSSYETDSCGNVFGDRSAASFSYGTNQADRKYASPHAHSRDIMLTYLRMAVRSWSRLCSSFAPLRDIRNAGAFPDCCFHVV